MGNLFQSKITYVSTAQKALGMEKTDDRKRNSLAFNILRFTQSENLDYSHLVNEIKLYRAQNEKKKQKKVLGSKFNRLSEAVLSGNLRVLRHQVTTDFRHINRKFKEFEDNTLLHFICQEGYFSMLEYVLDDKNHSDFDHVDLEINALNEKSRTPLLLCFTPPTSTWLGQKYGVGENGQAKSERPDGIEVASDWILPGGPRSRDKCISLLLDNDPPADPSLRDFQDFSCMHYAAMWGWTNVTKKLIEKKCDANAATLFGKTPLMLAVEGMNGGVVQVLLALGPDQIYVNASDSEGCTALIFASDRKKESKKKEKEEEIEEEKPEKEKDELGVEEEGEVTLEELEVEIMGMLLRAGADPDCMTHDRRTPLSIACSLQRLDMVNLLLDHGCVRDGVSLARLEGEAAAAIDKRLMEEEQKAKDEADRIEKEKQLKGMDGVADTSLEGYKSKSPWGAWVEYNDKRGGGIFYYNPVTRQSQRERPKDFKPDKNRAVKDVTFGMSFYH